MYEHYSAARSIKRSKLRSRARRLENTARRLFKLFSFILVMAVFYGLYRFMDSNLWYISADMLKSGRNIEYFGNSTVSDKKIFDIIQNTGLENKPLYLINPDKLTKELEMLPPVKRAYVRRRIFPAGLSIMINEAAIAILISPSPSAPEIAAYSFDGTFIGKEYMPLAKKNNTVKVLSFGADEDNYENWDEKKINMLYKLAKNTEHYSGEKVLYIDLRRPNNAFIQLESVKVRLGALDYNVFERIKTLASIMRSEEVKMLAPKTKYIDLSWSRVQYINVGSNEELENNKLRE